MTNSNTKKWIFNTESSLYWVGTREGLTATIIARELIK